MKAKSERKHKQQQQQDDTYFSSEENILWPLFAIIHILYTKIECVYVSYSYIKRKEKEKKRVEKKQQHPKMILLFCQVDNTNQTTKASRRCRKRKKEEVGRNNNSFIFTTNWPKYKKEKPEKSGNKKMVFRVFDILYCDELFAVSLVNIELI